MAPSSAEAEQSPLLRLSAELRNKIYAAAFSSPNGRPLLATSEPALLQTCRQIRSEALGLFHSSARLRVTIKDDDTDKINRWVDGLPPKFFARAPGLVIEMRDTGANMAELKDMHGKWSTLGTALGAKGMINAKLEIEYTNMTTHYSKMRKSTTTTNGTSSKKSTRTSNKTFNQELGDLLEQELERSINRSRGDRLRAALQGLTK